MVELPQGLSSLGAAAWSCKEGGWQGLYLFWGVYVGIEETASGLDLRPRQVLLLTSPFQMPVIWGTGVSGKLVTRKVRPPAFLLAGALAKGVLAQVASLPVLGIVTPWASIPLL